MAEQNSTNPEQWRSVPGFEGWYEVSDAGRVRSLPRRAIHRKSTIAVAGRIMVPVPQTRGGYLAVIICRNGQMKRERIHRLVAAAFIGPCPPGLQVNHIDGNSTNNRPANLEYVTPLENSRHAAEVLDRFPRGESHYHAKLTIAKITEAKALYASGLTCQRIADRFGVNRRTIGRAIAGESYVS